MTKTDRSSRPTTSGSSSVFFGRPWPAFPFSGWPAGCRPPCPINRNLGPWNHPHIHLQECGRRLFCSSARAFPSAASSPSCVEIKIIRRVRAESSRRPPRHRCDACSMAWRCRFLAARRDQRGRVIAIPDTLVDFHTDRHAFRTRLPPRFFLPVIISGGGNAFTFWALGGSQAFSIFDSMSSRND